MERVFSASQLEELGAGIFRAAGAPEEIAREVAVSLVLSNLVGHDSHGILRIPWYLEMVDKRTIVPAARPTVKSETLAAATVDGNWAYGQITARHAIHLAMEKARSSRLAAVGAVRCNHIGRLGEYTEMAAREGVVAFMVNATFGGTIVTPHGGAGRVLSTNPISFAVPAAEDEPVVADFATSVAAEGKLKVARATGRQLPPGVILDRDGNPSTDPGDFYSGGMLLPFGGHKGYALSVVADLLGRHVPGGEEMAAGRSSHGLFLMVVDVEAFRPISGYREAVEARLREIKGVRPAPGFEEVLVPGEPERRTIERRRRDGVVLPEDTYVKLSEAAARLGVPMPEGRSVKD